MSYELNDVVRHLMALAGADPRKVRLPEGKHKLRVHSQRIGDVRLITVAPWQGTLPEVDAQGIAHVCAENDLLLLRGIVIAPPRTKTLWLALDGVGAVPLVPASPRIEKALRALVQHGSSSRVSARRAASLCIRCKLRRRYKDERCAAT